MVPDITVAYRRFRNPPRRDAGAAWFAKRQAGVISIAQLHVCGLDDAAVARRVRAARLWRIHRGVYAVGHDALAPRGLWFAALLAGGPEAVLSHADALDVWGIRTPRGARPRVHITVPTVRRSTTTLNVHHGRPLITTRHGLRVTTVAQTLLDIAQTESESVVQTILTDAFLARRVRAKELLELASHARGRRGTALLRAQAQWQVDHDTVTRSELERAFLRLVTERGFQRPVTNHRLHGYEADFHWPDHALVVETDGLRCHTTPEAFARDRKRDRIHRARGLRVERVTWHDVTREPASLARELRAWLRAGTR